MVMTWVDDAGFFNCFDFKIIFCWLHLWWNEKLRKVKHFLLPNTDVSKRHWYSSVWHGYYFDINKTNKRVTIVGSVYFSARMISEPACQILWRNLRKKSRYNFGRLITQSDALWVGENQFWLCSRTPNTLHFRFSNNIPWFL